MFLGSGGAERIWLINQNFKTIQLLIGHFSLLEIYSSNIVRVRSVLLFVNQLLFRR